MKTNWFLSLLVLSAALLTGCADAELTSFPQIHVALQMSLVEDSPHYEVIVENGSGISIQEVGIVQRYQDKNTNHEYNSASRIDIFTIHAIEPYTYTDTGLNVYANDVITACAFIKTELGTFRSDEQTLVVPGTNVIQIESARFDFDEPTGNKGTLRVFGSNFSTSGGAISISGTEGLDTSGARLKCYHDSIVASGVKCNVYGTHNLKLRQYAAYYPIEVNVKGLQIDGISSQHINLGETFTIYYSNADPDGKYSFCSEKWVFSSYTQTIYQDKDSAVILPVPSDPERITSKTFRIEGYDGNRGIKIPSEFDLTIERKPWEKWGSCYGNSNCRVGKYICSTDGERIYGYNLETLWVDFRPRINPDVSITGYRMLAVDDRYAYIWYWSWSSVKGYLRRYDTQERKWEDVTSLKWEKDPTLTYPEPKAWFEDENTFRMFLMDKLYTYHLDTGSWGNTTYISPSGNSEGLRLTSDCQMCGTYKGYVYFGLSGKVYRYPVGDPLDVSYVGKPNLPLTKPFAIRNDTFYFEYQSYDFYSHDYFVYLYKMPMSSLLDGTNQITCIGSPDGIDYRTKVNLHETDTHYLVTLNGTVKAMKK